LAVFDISRERLKRTLLLGTRFGQPGMVLPAAPDEPYYVKNMFDPVNQAPLNTPLAPSAPDTPPGAPINQTSATAPLDTTPGAPPAPPPLPETPWPASQMDVGS
jgi:phospholipid/cholesterol/gamma-HCH transport system substrate-binding protein